MLYGPSPPRRRRPWPRVHSCPTAEGFSEVIMPGEREHRFEAKHRRTGVPYSSKEIVGLQDEAAKAGLPPLPLSDSPLNLGMS